MTSSIPSTLPEAIFLGFCPKQHWPISVEWQQWVRRPVQEVCSVSACLVKRPSDWEELWNFNRAWCWNDAERARAVIAPEHQIEYDLYAYQLIPCLFDSTGSPQVLSSEQLFETTLPALAPAPALDAYKRLGYDVVQFTQFDNDKLAGHGCSPLSCNGMANDYAVNQFCLLNTVEEAYLVADAFGRQEPEPGPYVIIEVLREISARLTTSEKLSEKH